MTPLYYLEGLFPLPLPEGFPVVLGPLGGRCADDLAILVLLSYYRA